jgi:uncharacterized SAM-binding protein YcdF (DUF218 family)
MADDDSPADEAPRRGRVKWGRVLLVFFVLGGGPIVYFHKALLRRLPPLMVTKDEPKAADALVVLAGDHRGHRVEYACELWKRGLVAKGPFVIPGGMLYKNLSWADVMKDHAVKNGVPEDRIILQRRSETTWQDAEFILPELKKRGVKSILLVTSPLHSGRAAKIFRQQCAPLGIEVISCPSRDDPPEAWWEDPVATRFLVNELLKRVY